MRAQLAYGSGHVDVQVPEGRTWVVAPRYPPAAPDGQEEVRRALRNPVAGPPLREIVRPGMTVAVSVCDITRPQPRREMLPALIEELSGTVRLDDIAVLVATGTHRANSPAELAEMLGPEVVGSVRVLNHDCTDASSLRWVGRLGADVPVWLADQWLSADLRITTGFVEPHFFAGFSGGPKMVAPGLAGLDTVLVLHDATRIGNPRATWGVRHGNPVHDDVRAIAAATGVHFACDVVLDSSKRIVAAFAGELEAMHDAACSLSRAVAMQAVDRRFDVVVTSNSGYPLDQNLYQSVKGMSAAAQVAAPGGRIICATECRDGFPEHGSYRRLITGPWGPEELLARFASSGETEPDQWSVQVQARIQSALRVAVHTSFLSAADLAQAHLDAATDLQATLDAALDEAGPQSTLCVLPDGPQTIPYVSPSTSPSTSPSAGPSTSPSAGEEEL